MTVNTMLCGVISSTVRRCVWGFARYSGENAKDSICLEQVIFFSLYCENESMFLGC